MVLDMLKQSILTNCEKKFIEFYLAYSFIRVEEFKEEFLKELTGENPKKKFEYQDALMNLNWK